MGYVIAAVLVLLIVGAGVTFMVLRAAKSQRSRAVADSEYGEGTPGSDAAIVAPDSNTPLGDTDQHAGEQTREGTTVGGQDAERSGGTGRPVGAGYEGTGEIGEGDREAARGGSATEGPTTAPPDSDEPSAPQPDSERLADRPR
jgi:hypothetical protein